MRPGMAAVIADSPAQVERANEVVKALGQLGLPTVRHVASPTTTPGFVLQLMQQLEASFARLILIAVGENDLLRAMLDATSSAPVLDGRDDRNAWRCSARSSSGLRTRCFWPHALDAGQRALGGAARRRFAPAADADPARSGAWLMGSPELRTSRCGTTNCRQSPSGSAENHRVVELHAFDAQWSEHCSYKSSRHYLERLPTDGRRASCSGPARTRVCSISAHTTANATRVVIAHESHNHPSQVVPFEGAATGIGGIVRDVLCMGAEVIAVADPLRFGSCDDVASHQRRLPAASSTASASTATRSAFPISPATSTSTRLRRERSRQRRRAGTASKRASVIHSFAPKGAQDWEIVLVGKATDPSGFGGASFSSLALDAQDAETNKGAVQVPDPFLKNVLMRASYRVFALLRERKIAAAFKDLGRRRNHGLLGGDHGAAAVTARRSTWTESTLPSTGMPPEVIAVGETQERLLWVVPPDVATEVLRIYNEEFSLPEVAYNARATSSARVTADRRYVLRYRGEVVMDVESDFLTGSIRDELPYTRGDPRMPGPLRRVSGGRRRRRSSRACWRTATSARANRSTVATTRSCAAAPFCRAARPMPASWRRFQARVLGVALAVAGNPRYGRIDPAYAAEHAVVEAMRRVVAVGARPIGLTDCLNFGNPRKPDQFGEFVAAVDGLARAAAELDLPFVSGNVSLYNEAASGSAVPASAIVACVGALDDVAETS